MPTVGLGNTGEASTESLPRPDRLKIPTHTATWSKFSAHEMWRSPIGVPAWLASVLANSRRSPGEGPGAPRSTYCCRGRRDPDADRRNDRGSAGHRAHRPDELSSHLPFLSRSRVGRLPGYGQPVSRELGKRWLGSSAAPAGDLATDAGLVAQARSLAVASRRPKDFQIQILGDRRGAGPELIGEQDAAALERSQRLREVAGLTVGPHQQPIARLPEGIERQDLLHVLNGESVVALAEQ